MSATQNLSGAYDLNMLLVPREIIGYVEAMASAYPEVDCYMRGDLYEDMVFTNPDDALTYTKEHLDALRIDVTKELWIMLLATEANKLENDALLLHTESHHTLQKQVYDLKYAEAVTFQKAIEDAGGDPTGVTPPPMIVREATATGEDPVALMQTIITNYLQSNYVISDYIGILEGQRRTSKVSIQACQTIEDLNNLEWPQWLLFKDYMIMLQAQMAQA